MKIDGICIIISRINHSCGPNSDFCLNDEGEVEIRANSKILAGQEVTISYMPSKASTDVNKNHIKRQKILSGKMGFLCSCELCKDKDCEDNTYDHEDPEEFCEMFDFLFDELRIA